MDEHPLMLIVAIIELNGGLGLNLDHEILMFETVDFDPCTGGRILIAEKTSYHLTYDLAGFTLQLH